MTQARHDVRINRPIQEVFDFLADGTNNPRWQPPVIRTTPTGETLDLGSAFQQKVRHPLGFTVSADYRITAYGPPHLLATVITSGGPLRPNLTYTLTATAAGATEVECLIEYHPSGLGRLASPALALLYPLFAWEASWIERARNLLEPTSHRTS
jgi:uncharacterized protein YndB with AHSA1/START domain